MWPAMTQQQQWQSHQRQGCAGTVLGQVQQHLQELVAGLSRKLRDATPQAVSNSLRACAQLRVYPAELFAALDSQQQWSRLLPAFNRQDLANTALACGEVDHRDEQLLRLLLQQALQLQEAGGSTGKLNSWEVCHICWSVAVLDFQQLASSVIKLVEAAASVQQQWMRFGSEGLVQLHQAHLWLLDKQPLVGGRGLAGALTEQQLQQCIQAAAQMLLITAAESPSQFERDVFAALQRLTRAGALSWRQAPQQEQLAVPDNACLIDIAGVTAAGVRLAIEVDGPYHFLWPNGRLNGPTQHRNRVLAARGCAVVSVRYTEWADLKGAQDKQQHLLKLIKTAIQQQRRRERPLEQQAPTISTQ
ncbi:hypothetical protein COO60DRAFT_1047049 [Scenedesmus sp. NREL 46B-D3]|nr:hypothetical protein COO60DRAFT_1047049 [Scenedesmus sp. NREL 46B-D3]